MYKLSEPACRIGWFADTLISGVYCYNTTCYVEAGQGITCRIVLLLF